MSSDHKNGQNSDAAQQNPGRPIVLIGMMGAGKTQIGRALAEHLALEFVDCDQRIEARAGMSIPEIFSTYGEEKFRSVEHNVLTEALEKGACVISTGGGVVLRDENLNLMLEKGIVVWLDVPADILWARVKNCENRPLLKSENPRQTLEELLSARKDRYARAHIRLQIGRENAERVLENLTKILSESPYSARV